MAQHVRIELVDDLDGSSAQETVAFAIDGVAYEIDLSEGNASKLRESLTPWTTHARRVGGRKTKQRINMGSDNQKIRAWALEQGLEVSARGRISAEIRDAYAQAH